jgi:predicted phage tail protein
MERYSGLVVHLHQRWEFVAKGEKMIARIVGNMILSVTVFVVVTLMVGLGVSWWSGGLLSGAVAGLICGLAAALVVGAVRITMGRSAEHARERQGDENERSGRGPDREEK